MILIKAILYGLAVFGALCLWDWKYQIDNNTRLISQYKQVTPVAVYGAYNTIIGTRDEIILVEENP